MPILNADQSAKRIGVVERTIRRWIENGELRAKKVSGQFQIDTKDLDRLAHQKRHLLQRRGLKMGSEFEAMQIASDVLTPLKPAVRKRVIQYLNDRFG